MAGNDLLAPSDVLTPGGSYTFVFSPGFNMLTELDVNAGVQSIDYLSPGTVNNHLGAGPVDVQFTYEGDGRDTVASVAQDIHDAVSHQTWGSFGSLQEARGGTIAQGPPPNAPPDDGKCSLMHPGNCVPSTTTIVVVLVLVGLIVFMFEGGLEFIPIPAAAKR